MRSLVFLAFLFLSATSEDVVRTTSQSSVTLPSVPTTDEILEDTPTSTVNSIENIAQVIPEKIEEDKYHHCTACPFESDHHKCNDPFKLSKSFEVSGDMCNKINTDKSQVDRLCKRYPKGYFFQCPKDGSSYTCKASCGVRVEDVGKGLLDADIKDMPGGLLSGLGFNNKRKGSPSQNQPQGIDLFNSMGDIFHSVQQPGPPHGHVHSPSQQHPNQFQVHQNQFAGPHNAYPGSNPLFQQHQNMFQNQNTPLMPFHHPSNNPFVSQVPVQPHHHVFGGFTGFGTPNPNAQPLTNFPHPPPPSPEATMPVPPSPKANIKNPTASVVPIVTTNPVNKEPLASEKQGVIPTVQPAAVQSNDVPRNPNQVVQANKAVQDIINGGNQHPTIGNAGKNKPQNPSNFGFGTFGHHPNNRPPFQHHTNFFHGPMLPVHNFGQTGFMNKPVQGSASKATQNLHSFMGGFDDFNNGFHGFAAGIGHNSPKRANPLKSNGGSFFNSLFSFKKR